MATGLEVNILSNIIGIFGGSVVLMALMFFALTIITLLYFGLPFIVMLPIVGVFMLLFAYLIPELGIIFALIFGLILGGWLLSLVSGR